eukprot:CAMPEP_0204246446 /NCGR_PEP_ID=MMETSP0361-20130328/98145_1 /ASSEMBLY_ACC=CAM_ASM_000343 /TAXON_ID=268821 /ORGANISM="Scrippsiella Hangoei, Strain SHTV-5" /LENGTH=284 /DNA_ID=CAMNT_0051219665 /DNA_START=26 /DNA_END=876 /DNA_ORIENTATION=-
MEERLREPCSRGFRIFQNKRDLQPDRLASNRRCDSKKSVAELHFCLVFLIQIRQPPQTRPSVAKGPWPRVGQTTSHRPRRAREAHPNEHHAAPPHVPQEPLAVSQRKQIGGGPVEDVPGLAIDSVPRDGPSETSAPGEELDNLLALEGGKPTAGWRSVAARLSGNRRCDSKKSVAELHFCLVFLTQIRQPPQTRPSVPKGPWARMGQTSRHRPRRAREAHPDANHAAAMHVAKEPLAVSQRKQIGVGPVDDVPGLAIDPVLGDGPSETGAPGEELDNLLALEGG